jgi:hypothetical protein
MKLPVPPKVFGQCWRTLWFKKHILRVTPRRVICARCGTIFRFPRAGYWRLNWNLRQIYRVK